MKKKPEQLSFIPKLKSYFGGSYLHRRRRSLRPLNSKESLHLVLRSSWAYGRNSFLQKCNKSKIDYLIGGIARKYDIKVYRKAIVSNHIHLIIKFRSRKTYKIFIRVLTSQIASHVMKGQSFKEFKKSLEWGDPRDRIEHESEIQGLEQAFWQFRPFSRIIPWGKAFKKACDYVVQNALEAMGFIPYIPRSKKTSRFG